MITVVIPAHTVTLTSHVGLCHPGRLYYVSRLCRADSSGALCISKISKQNPMTADIIFLRDRLFTLKISAFRIVFNLAKVQLLNISMTRISPLSLSSPCELWSSQILALQHFTH